MTVSHYERESEHFEGVSIEGVSTSRAMENALIEALYAAFSCDEEGPELTASEAILPIAGWRMTEEQIGAFDTLSMPIEEGDWTLPVSATVLSVVDGKAKIRLRSGEPEFDSDRGDGWRW